MCYATSINKSTDQLQNRFAREFTEPELFVPIPEISGFVYPGWPIITEANTTHIEIGVWGLIPGWGASDLTAFRKKTNTLNAMIETVSEKPTYKNFVNQRCLVAVDAFFEWKHIGKEKIKHRITVPGEDIFCLAGIYSLINDVPYYTILTTEANTLMAEVHNTKKRMPVVLHRDEEQLWLADEPREHYFDRNEIELEAVPVLGVGQSVSLF